MNKTFKVVFNKARGALMVANEVTSSVQKKGMRTIVATASLLTVGCVANTALAYNYNYITEDTSFEGQTFSGEIVYDGGIGMHRVKNANLSSKNNYYTNIIATYKDTGEVMTSKDSPVGAAYYLYSMQDGQYSATFENDKFEGNQMVVGGKTTTGQWAKGGALTIKGYTATFTDTEFKNNKIVATTTDAGVAAVGGAIMLDKTLNTSNANTTANFIFTKDITYSGNTVSNSNDKASTTLYGGTAYSSGGFLFMDRQSTANFIVNEGATFTLGVAGDTDKNADTIASSMTTDSDATKYGGHNLITKQGAGTFVINSSLSDYNGLVKVQAGTMKVTSAWKIRNAVTISGGTLDLSASDYSISSIAACAQEFNNATLSSDAASGSITLAGGTLIANVGKVFSSGDNDATFSSDSLTIKTGYFLSKGTLSLTSPNEKYYTTGFFNALASTFEKNSDIDFNLVDATLKIESSDSDSGGDQATEITHNTTVASLDAEEASVTVKGKTLTIGSSESATSTETSKVKTLTLSDSNSKLIVTNNSTVEVTTLDVKGEVNLTDDSTLDVQELTGTNAKISVGTVGGAGATLNVAKLSLKGGSIFVDPAQLYDSSVQFSELDEGTLSTNITAGTGAFVTIGTTVDSAKAAVSKLDGFNNLKAIVYIGTPITIDEEGSIVVQPSVRSAVVDKQQTVYVASDGGLVIDQSAVGNSTVFKGATSVTFDGGKLGLVNATVGTLTLIDDGATLTLDINDAVTDNPFVEVASITKTGLTTQISATGGLGALASTGMQAMTRRADAVLAQTIADRTSVDQDYAAGTALWVDVTGERYQADKLENNASFKSDMGYGAFGGDFAITEDISAGAAIQYGKGTVRSSVSSIKNSIDSYGITAYGSMKFGDAKVVAEASYVKNENDITSSQTALNQSVDTEVYSLGIRGQHRFTAGSFQFVPSVGVRVSRLNTDAMKVGAVNIKKQEQTLVQVPIALRINGFEQNAGGWSVAPSFKIAYVPTFGDKEISVLGADQTVIDTSPVQGDFGIRAQKGNLMLNANFMVGGGKDGTSSVGGKAGLKYVF